MIKPKKIKPLKKIKTTILKKNLNNQNNNNQKHPKADSLLSKEEAEEM